MEWMNEIKMTEKEEKYVRLLWKNGCHCELPLLGYNPGKGPRCRMCNVEVSLSIEELLADGWTLY